MLQPQYKSGEGRGDEWWWRSGRWCPTDGVACCPDAATHCTALRDRPPEWADSGKDSRCQTLSSIFFRFLFHFLFGFFSFVVVHRRVEWADCGKDSRCHRIFLSENTGCIFWQFAVMSSSGTKQLSSWTSSHWMFIWKWLNLIIMDTSC